MQADVQDDALAFQLATDANCLVRECPPEAPGCEN
jgi:hypothetical protein